MRAGALALVLVLAACGQAGTNAGAGATAAPDAGPLEYPAGPYGTSLGATVSDAAWPGVSAAGSVGTVSLGVTRAETLDTAVLPPVLVVRIGASWCGPCAWHASHSSVLLQSDVGARVRLFDVLLDGPDNAPATLPDAVAWQATQDVATEVAIDPALTVQRFLPTPTRLPYVLVLDARTMTLLATLSMPTEDALEQALRVAMASIDGTPVPAAPSPQLVDGRFTRDEWDMIAAMTLTDPPPPDPTNAYADSIPAAALGGKIFVDPSFSPSGIVSCSACHAAEYQFADGFPTPPEGVARLTRNAPSLTYSAHNRWQFWDGRADSLWGQATGPMEAPNEFGSSRLFIAHALYATYQLQYQAIFGPLPPLDDTARFPPAGKPGDPAWEAMAPADQYAITQIFVNIGKSLAAYERTFRGAGAQLDAYAGGSTTALTDQQKDGLLAFFQAGCAQCHWGPLMSDGAFHNLRFPSGVINSGDPGRQTGIPEYLASEFTAGGVWSDDVWEARDAPLAGPWTFGAFKTPQIRNVALTAPYGHGGNYVQLSQVVDLIRTGGMPAGSPITSGTVEPWVAPFDPSSEAALVAFLQILDENIAH
jgi:cytochrome c peroxidase